jgi:tetratricopeptide (TPR) repeat protein
MKDEKFIEAVQYYARAYQLEPENTEYHFKLAESFIGKRWFEEANHHLEQLVETYPDSIRFWKRLGFARNHGGMFEQAVAAYERVLELEPDEEQNTMSLSSALLNRGAQLQKEGDFESARTLYARVIHLYPTGWRAFNNLATIEMELENYIGAYDILEASLELHPSASNLNFNMGIVLEKLGRYREALEYLRRSADLDPLSSKAGDHIERIENKLRGADGD